MSCSLAIRRSLCLIVAALALATSAASQMVSGQDMPGFREALRLTGSSLAVRQVGASTGPNVLWPNEKIEVQAEITNRTGQPMELDARIQTIGYRTSVPNGDIWVPRVYPVGQPMEVSVGRIRLDARASVVVTFRPNVPSRLGGYGLVLDAGTHGRYFVGSVARVLQPQPGKIFEPAYSMDMPWPHEMSPEVVRTFSKLGVKGCRMGAGYVPTLEPRFQEQLRFLDEILGWCRQNDVSVMLTIGEGGAPMPLGRGRPWLRDDDTMIEGAKEDLAWLPSYDEDFRRWVRLICERYGWPTGPINAVELWNEPWEGVSISGWGADLPRYREIYRQMGLGVMDARKSGAKVLIGGCSSSSNTRDKLFCDGRLDFLPMLDFVSIHYEGLGASPGLDPLWMGRKGEYGRTRVWDTESWVANSEDRIPGVVASMLSFGQDRAMGTYGGNIYRSEKGSAGGRSFAVVQAWPPAAAVAAAARFIGQRQFERLLFPNGLPWLYVFTGSTGPDDGTMVLQGDLTTLYEPEYVLYRDVQLAMRGRKATIRIPADPAFRVYDCVGNLVAPVANAYTLPLGTEGYYLRTDGSRGSFDRLKRAVSGGRIEGLQPVSLAARDFLDTRKALRVSVTNILNRKVQGTLSATIAGNVRAKRLELDPNTTREETFDFSSLPDVPNNLYAGTIRFESPDGTTVLKETYRVNQIAHRTVQVDGDLTDWRGVLPQAITAEALARSLTDAAWKPFQQALEAKGTGAAEAFLAEDDLGLYFAARIYDPTPHPGMVRFETRDDDAYYYPQTSYSTSRTSGFGARFTGLWTANSDGEFELVAETDDGVRLWVNDNLLIDQWRDRGATRDSARVKARRGEALRIRMEYFQSGGDAVARLLAAAPGREPEVLHLNDGKAEFFAEADLLTPIGARAIEHVDFRLGPDFPGVAGANRARYEWPQGVRRFSYRKDPDLPSGNGEDNVQIAFNVLPPQSKPLKMAPKGVMPRYMVYPDTDYEYALNQVAERYGGGTEVFRLSAPGVPRKHFYPRQPKAPLDGGPVRDAKLVVRRDKDYRIVEAFLPWSEIPEVKKARDAGRTVKFSFRVNDSNGPSYELAQHRSVSKGNNWAFHNDWTRHWANEIEFSFERGGNR